MNLRRTCGAAATATLVLSAALAGSATAATAPDASGATVDPLLTKALDGATTPVEAVVTFDGDGAPDTSDVDLLRDLGITTGTTLRSIPVAGVLATTEQVEQLSESPGVRSVFLNRELSYENDDYTALTGVDDVRTDAKLTERNGGLPVTGAGVGVVVNDSGIDGTHRDLAYPSHVVQNVEGATNLNALEPTLLPVTYVEDVANTDATGGHGTHVAGIVGATGGQSGGKYEGVAPGADLIGYGSGAGLLLLDVLTGFDYALTNQQRYDIRVVTNSWGSSGDSCTDVDPTDPINVATKELYDRNVVVVFSAGNSGPEECTISGNYKKAPWVMNVAAGDRERDLAEFSSRGTPGGGGSFEMDGETFTWQDRPTLTAPGVDVVSTRTVSPVGALGTPKDLETVDPAHQPFYTTLSGTSMAAPHVAGVVALMLEAQPTLTPDQVTSILKRTATDMPGYATWEAGDGYVDAYAAVVKAARTR